MVSNNNEGRAVKVPTFDELREVITAYYGHRVWQALKAGLAVVCSLATKGRTMPLTLIYEGASGLGKSTCINVLVPDREATEKIMYRLDQFTPKSFVSHAANVSKEEIEQIDVLPKLKNKVLLTKELAPVFHGSDSDLRDKFATLTAVLDGKGYVSASGVHGTRGYGAETIFNWIGGTTPIPEKTDTIMAQLGNRMLRYEFEGAEVTEDELVAYLEDSTHHAREKQHRTMVNSFLADFFAAHPVSSIPQEDITLGEQAKRDTARLAQLIAHGRVEVRTASDGADDIDHRFVAGTPEGPFRVAQLLKQLGHGLALVAGRREVTTEDVLVLRHVAFSCIPPDRRELLRLVANEGGPVSSRAVEKQLRLSRPTARRRMQLLAATGIVHYGKGGGNEAAEVSLAKEWEWLHIAVAKQAPAAQEEREAVTG